MLDNKSLADVPSKTMTYFQHAGRHFVSLSFNQYLASDDTETPRPAVVSGFIVESHDIWFYATAGHVINGIRGALNAGVRFDAWRLGDDTAGSRFPAVPIDFEIGQCVVMHDNCIGLDYAVFPLHVLTARNLKAGGVVPIDRTTWKAIPLNDLDDIFILGVPSETVATENPGVISAKTALILLTLVPAPQSAGLTEDNMFFAKLQMEECHLKDIGGMSGGPIFGTKRVENETRYWAIGVQSGWYPTQKIIAACPLPAFMDAIEEIVGKIVAEHGRP